MKRIITIITALGFLTGLSYAQTVCDVSIYESIIDFDVDFYGTYSSYEAGDTISEDTDYEWLIEGSTHTGNPVSHTFTDPGEYDISVTATGLTSGCVATASKTILVGIDPLDVSLEADYVDPDDYGTGYVNATVTGGVGPFYYAWSNGSEGEGLDEITDLPPGNYCVTVTDDLDYTAEACIMLESEDPLTADLTLTQLDPADGCSVQATVTVTGGEPSYTYHWPDSPSETGEVVDGFCVGDTICVEVTDDLGSTAGDCETILGPCDGFYASYSITPASDMSSTDGAIDLSVTGGVAPYSYSWSDGSDIQDIDGVASGYYTVTITDAIGCEREYSIFIPASTEPAEDLTISSFSYVWDDTDPDDIKADVTVNIEGGVPDYDYHWKQSSAMTIFINETHTGVSDTHDMVTGAEPGYTVYVTVTDDEGDNAYASVEIPEYDPTGTIGGSMSANMDTCLIDDEWVEVSVIDYWVDDDDILYASWHVEYSTGADATLVINYGNVSGIDPGTYELYLFVDCDVDFKTMSTYVDYIELDESMVGIEPTQAKQNGQVELYPNPVKNNVFIKTSNNIENGQVYITDASGRLLIYHRIDTSNEIIKINTADLPSGMYFLSIEGDDTCTVEKFIK